MQRSYPLATKSILVVEDDLDIRLCLQELFEGDGHSVLFATHGKAALELLDTNPSLMPGLIMLDLMIR